VDRASDQLNEHQKAESDDEWVTFERVPGPSARWYFRASATGVVSGFLLVGGVVFYQVTHRAGFSEVIPNIVLVLIFALLPASYLLAKLLTRKTRMERSAGYTTSTIGWTDLPQIDPATGVVVRRAGRPLLNFEEKADARRRVAAFKARTTTGG